MATYRQIADDVKSRTGRTVKTCWIAHVKSLHGLTSRVSPNRISTESRVYPCPDIWVAEIEQSMRNLGEL
ncbi:hypothetical protein C5P45_25720 [Escherichia coli]|jgi:hypothetical protein|nr:hypothetical protein [Escherichia coli]EFB5483723.1 hypothetical protein [Escherichia coli]EFB5500326.1 hypothetical protein [Escherichia coli]MHW51468.1 hypothetical protein [Escherichia coli]PPY80591.1 hypothetical protein C5P45_25720 [Escherichia coli]